MLASIISQYLKENRRLVIPQLGAFLVKEPNRDIVFSTLITRDDGVLNKLLIESGVSELEASGMIQRICFDVRYVIENGGEYLLDDFGRFSRLESGALQFVVTAKPEEVVEAAETAAEVEEPSDADTDIVEQEGQQEELPEKDNSPKEISIEMDKIPVAFEQDPDLEGLNYGESRRSRRVSRGGVSPHRKGTDWWLICGVGAIALAVVAILYGFLRSGAEW